MSRVMLLAAAAALWLPGHADAQTNAIDCGGLDRGYQAWISSGATAAVAEWISESPIQEADGLIPVMGQFEASNGKIRGYEVIRDVRISQSLRRVYVMAIHDIAPTFAYFDCYRPKDRWVVTNIQLHANGDEILPAEALWTGSDRAGT